jgi:hypothetical protein
MTESNTKNAIQKILDTDFANLACLLDLLSEHHVVQEHPTLSGGVAAIKKQYVGIWERLELVVE